MASSLKSVKARASRVITSSRLAMLKNEGMLHLGLSPKVRRDEKIEQTWKALLTDPPINHSDTNNWREGADVRPSSFPFCPRKYVMERLGLTMPSDFDVKSCFYTEVGKAVHYVGQNALARTGRLWGFWACARPSCKALWKDKAEPSFYPEGEVCAKCEANVFEYEEMQLRDDDLGLRGHTDGVLVFKRHSSVLEIKTSDDTKVEDMKNMSDAELAILYRTESPWYGYWHQASTYASLVREKYGHLLPPMREVNYLIYSRNSPLNVVAFTLEVPEDDSWWKEIRARIKMAQRARKLTILPVGFAESKGDIDSLPSCRWCTYKEVCLEPGRRIRYAADALYDNDAREALDKVLNRERTWDKSSEATSPKRPT